MVKCKIDLKISVLGSKKNELFILYYLYIAYITKILLFKGKYGQI